MFKKNITLWDSIRRKDKELVVIKSIIWNEIIKIIKETKKIDISSYLVSISIRWNIIFVKTTKPIVNHEIMEIRDLIIERSKEKLWKIWIKFYDFDIKCL